MGRNGTLWLNCLQMIHLYLVRVKTEEQLQRAIKTFNSECKRRSLKKMQESINSCFLREGKRHLVEFHKRVRAGSKLIL